MIEMRWGPPDRSHVNRAGVQSIRILTYYQAAGNNIQNRISAKLSKRGDAFPLNLIATS